MPGSDTRDMRMENLLDLQWVISHRFANGKWPVSALPTDFQVPTAQRATTVPMQGDRRNAWRS